MRRRARWGLSLGIAGALASGCSASSSGAPVASDDAGQDAVSATGDDAGAAPQDAAPAAVCDAASLATIDAGATACFACQASQCAAELAACSTDCTCAPVYSCLQANSMGGINSGYSACPDAIAALMNSNAALTASAACATKSCHPECFGSTN
jgi:hypothetical protein